MQSDRPQAFAVICRKAGGSVQVLLHKVGKGPPTEKRWAFIGGAMQLSEEMGDNYYGALLRIVNRACNGDVAPSFQLQHFALTVNPTKPISYHVVTVPTGQEHWPSNKDSNDTVTIGGHTFTAKHGGFAWIDYGNLINETKRRNQQVYPSAVHLGVLQWFSYHGDLILSRLGYNPQQASAGSAPIASSMSTDGPNGKSPCKYILNGKCRYGQNCRYSHDIAPAAAAAPPVAMPGVAAPPLPSFLDPVQQRALAEVFLTHYFTHFATGNEAIMTVYQPTSVLTFDGQPAVGQQQIAERLKAVHAQQVKMQPNTLFVQSVPGGGILLSTSGVLSTTTQTPPQVYPFSMVFVLMQQGPSWSVTNQMWWVHRTQ